MSLAALQQFNVQYLPNEDRLLLRIRFDDDSEIPLWLTRRYCKELLAAIDGLSDTAAASATSTIRTQAQQAIKRFQREAAAGQSDFTTAYQENAGRHPLGREPLLLTRLGTRSLENGSVRLDLGESRGKTIHLNLSPHLLHSLTHLLLLVIGKTGWALAEDDRPQSTGQPDSLPLH